MAAPTLKTNPFTAQYGALKGWQWAAIIGTLGGVLLYLKSRGAASSTGAPASSSATTGQGTDAYGNPIPGQQILAPIILQQGPASVPAPAAKPPPAKPKTPAPAGYSWQLVNGVWRLVHFGNQGPLPPSKPKPKTPAPAGYSWQWVNGVWRLVHFGNQGPLPKAATKPAPKPPARPVARSASQVRNVAPVRLTPTRPVPGPVLR
jgi:hypothetical protein